MLKIVYKAHHYKLVVDSRAGITSVLRGVSEGRIVIYLIADSRASRTSVLRGDSEGRVCFQSSCTCCLYLLLRQSLHRKGRKVSSCCSLTGEGSKGLVWVRLSALPSLPVHIPFSFLMLLISGSLGCSHLMGHLLPVAKPYGPRGLYHVVQQVNSLIPCINACLNLILC